MALSAQFQLGFELTSLAATVSSGFVNINPPALDEFTEVVNPICLEISRPVIITASALMYALS